SDQLLDTYQAERQAHAEDLIDWAVSLGRLMEHLADVERATREGRAPPSALPALQSSGYGQGRGMPGLKGGVIDPSRADDDTAIGHLFAQPVVRAGNGAGNGAGNAAGKECRLDDLLGSGFALVGRDHSALSISDHHRAVLERLGGRCVSLQGITPVRGEFDRIFRTADAVLVRPDRQIFGYTVSSHATDEGADLCASLGPELCAGLGPELGRHGRDANALIEALAATLHLSTRDVTAQDATTQDGS
ncbi:MAG: hypothetical protein ACKOBM_03320, partial [Gammaproteobacteria bacterium]